MKENSERGILILYLIKYYFKLYNSYLIEMSLPEYCTVAKTLCLTIIITSPHTLSTYRYPLYNNHLSFYSLYGSCHLLKIGNEADNFFKQKFCIIISPCNSNYYDTCFFTWNYISNFISNVYHVFLFKIEIAK